jgi:hypothetical protein
MIVLNAWVVVRNNFGSCIMSAFSASAIENLERESQLVYYFGQC